MSIELTSVSASKYTASPHLPIREGHMQELWTTSVLMGLPDISSPFVSLLFSFLMCALCLLDRMQF